MRKLIYFLFILVTLQSCGSNESSYDEDYSLEEYGSSGYEDGTYCAEVEYYNPNTGTNNTYTLEVEVYNNELTQINWGNGGWMDEDHFTSEELDSDGTCSFTSDKGYEYTVQITGQDCGYTDESTFESDVQEDEEAVTCPKCGDEKDSEYDDYCYWCERKTEDEEENTCSNCGAYEIAVYGGLCSSCEDSEY